jgi:hypothetical protein
MELFPSFTPFHLGQLKKSKSINPAYRQAGTKVSKVLHKVHKGL